MRNSFSGNLQRKKKEEEGEGEQQEFQLEDEEEKKKDKVARRTNVGEKTPGQLLYASGVYVHIVGEGKTQDAGCLLAQRIFEPSSTATRC